MHAAHFLIPDGPSLAVLIITATVFGLLVLGPLVEAAQRHRWGWFFAILLVGPVVGMGWLLMGRRQAMHAINVP